VVKPSCFLIGLLLCSCTTQVALEGNPMPERQVTDFMKVISPASVYDTPPRFLRGFAPDYPPTGNGHWGYAALDFSVEPDGSTADIRLVTATAYDFAQEAALAVQKWHFAPARKSAQPVRTRVWLPFTFRA
jgi:TonB family protein